MRQVLALDELHDKGAPVASGFAGSRKVFQAVDIRDVRVLERRKDLGFPLESRKPIGILGKGVWQNLDRDVAIGSLVSRAR